MARILTEGFELGGNYYWQYSGTAPTIGTATMPDIFTGTNYLITTNDTGFQRALPATKYELYLAFKYRVAPVYSQGICGFLDADGNRALCLARNTLTGCIEARRGQYSDTVLGTSANALFLSTAYLIEVYYKPLNTNGRIVVRVDGNTVIDYTGDTTQNAESIGSFGFGRFCGSADGAGWWDDIVVDDATGEGNWIGNTKVGLITPGGAGTTTQWDPSTGNNYACVDEVPPVDTDFVSTNTTDEIDTYAMSTISSMNTIKSVMVQSRSAKEGNPTPTTQKLVVRSGGADYVSAAKAVPLTFGEPIFNIWELNPADSAAWEQADIDGIECGIKATA